MQLRTPLPHALPFLSLATALLSLLGPISPSSGGSATCVISAGTSEPERIGPMRSRSRGESWRAVSQRSLRCRGR
jgi:hypothetical protein